MIRKVMKVLLFLLTVLISPVLLLAVPGGIYILIQLAREVPASQSVALLQGYVLGFLPYVTGVSAVFSVITLFLRRKEIKRWLSA